MPAGFSGPSASFFNAVKGKFSRSYREKPTDLPSNVEIEERVTEHGTFYNVMYDYLEGRVRDIKLVPRKAGGVELEKGKYQVTLVDDQGEMMIFSMMYDSSYAKWFFNVLANTPDFSNRTLRFRPWRMENSKVQGQFFVGMTVYDENGNKLERKYGKDQIPDAVAVMVSGKPQRDYTEQLAFFEKVWREELLPQLHKPESQADRFDRADSMTAGGGDVSDDVSDDETFDDVPF